MDKQYKPFGCVIEGLMANVINDSSMNESLIIEKFNSLLKLNAMLIQFADDCIVSKLLDAIGTKMGDMIMSATTVAELRKIIKPKLPHYNGVKFMPDKYNIPELEVILWSKTSLIAPLNEIGYKRYLGLMKDLFPEEMRDIAG